MTLLKVGPRGLDDEMDMAGRPASVGPEADVNLLCGRELLDARRSPLEHRPEFVRFGCGEFADVETVPKRFEKQRAHAEWANAMLDHPVFAGEHSAARQLPSAIDEVACEAIAHGFRGAA